VRGVVFTVVAAFAAAGLLYRYFTNPGAIRQQVIDQLQEQFTGASVRLESAHLNLFGGITVADLQLARRDDADHATFLTVPAATIYHDKEQLLDGKLAIRKVELQHPRLRVLRRADGSCNLAGVLGPVDPNQPLPIIVIHGGTILFEDQRSTPDMAPLELHDVSITLLNDPLPVLQLRGRGKSDLAGAIEVDGAWQRVSEALALTAKTSPQPIGPALLARLGAYCPAMVEHTQQLEGTIKAQVHLEYAPGADCPWHHDARCELHDGKLSHPQLPLPLDHLQATAHCVNGQVTLESLTAQSGPTRLALKGTASAFCVSCGEADIEGELTLEHLQLNPQLFARLPAPLPEIQTDFAPVGPINLEMSFGRSNGVWRHHSRTQLDDVAARFIEFPYPLEHIKGTIEREVDPARGVNLRRLDVVGLAGSEPVHVRGELTGPAPKPAVDLKVWGSNIVLNKTLQEALPDKYKDLAASFHPTGRGDFHADVWRKAGESCSKHVVVQFHDAAIRYDVFPYPLEDVSGVLEILPDHWEFRDFHGRHKSCECRTWGGSRQTPEGDRVHIDIRVANLLLDSELETALPARLKSAWATLAPTGRMTVNAQVERAPGQPEEDVDVTVNVRGCALQPEFFPLSLNVQGGSVHYARNQVTLENIVGRHGPTALSLERGDIFLKPAGGFYARLTDLRGNPVVPDKDFVDALPPMLHKLAVALHLRDPLGMTAKQLIVDMPPEANVPPVVYWDGGLALRGAKLQIGVDLDKVNGQFWCRGRHNGHQLEGLIGNLMLDEAVLFKQPFRDVHTHVEVSREAPEVLRLPDLKAKFFGGDIGGEARLEFGPTLQYELNLTALQVLLEEFGRHNVGDKVEWNGQASARLFLRGRGSDVQGLEGHGSIDVPSGKMYNLPLLLDLLKVLGLRVPDRTAFEEAHASFTIKGPRVTVTRLDLFGNAISLSGQGEMNLDGSDVQLDFYAVWGRIMQLLPSAFRPIPSVMSQQLLKIKMRGQVGDVHCTKEPVPVLVEPLERLLKHASSTSPTTDH
jgi:hypothetical protein